MVNDVAANREDNAMWKVVAEFRAGYVCMHAQGLPTTMQKNPAYKNVVREVGEFFRERLKKLNACGVSSDQVVFDPGIGFGKTTAHNLELLRRLSELLELGRPLVIGTSRKSFLGKITARPIEDRIAATIATNVLAYTHGARIFRVHDAAPVHDALAIVAATVQRPCPTTTPTNSTIQAT